MRLGQLEARYTGTIADLDMTDRQLENDEREFAQIIGRLGDLSGSVGNRAEEKKRDTIDRNTRKGMVKFARRVDDRFDQIDAANASLATGQSDLKGAVISSAKGSVRRVEALKTVIADLQTKVDALPPEFQHVKDELSKASGELNALTTSAGQIQSAVAAAGTQLEAQKNAFGQIQSEITQLKQFVENKVNEITAKVKELTKNFEPVLTGVNNLVRNYDGKIAQLEKYLNGSEIPGGLRNFFSQSMTQITEKLDEAKTELSNDIGTKIEPLVEQITSGKNTVRALVAAVNEAKRKAEAAANAATDAAAKSQATQDALVAQEAGQRLTAVETALTTLEQATAQLGQQDDAFVQSAQALLDSIAEHEQRDATTVEQNAAYVQKLKEAVDALEGRIKPIVHTVERVQVEVKEIKVRRGRAVNQLEKAFRQQVRFDRSEMTMTKQLAQNMRGLDQIAQSMSRQFNRVNIATVTTAKAQRFKQDIARLGAMFSDTRMRIKRLEKLQQVKMNFDEEQFRVLDSLTHDPHGSVPLLKKRMQHETTLLQSLEHIVDEGLQWIRFTMRKLETDAVQHNRLETGGLDNRGTIDMTTCAKELVAIQKSIAAFGEIIQEFLRDLEAEEDIARRQAA